MSLSKPSFPSSAAFDVINATLNASDAERKEAIGMAKAVFQIDLKNAEGKEESWTLDLKDEGKVSAGAAKKANVTLSLSDENFGKLVTGSANAQKLFMGGKLKIKGDVMKATKLDPIFKKSQAQMPKAKL